MDYREMTPAARYDALEEMAPQIFGTTWKGQLAACYGISPRSVTHWRADGAPIWVAVAVSDRLRALRLAQALEI